jgi:hypothetical protein
LSQACHDVGETNDDDKDVCDMRHIIKSLSRALASNLNPVEQGVHFHGGPQGAYVCDYADCVSPTVDPARL